MTDISSINPLNDGSSEHYTPTTEEVRDCYTSQKMFNDAPDAEFDRWLAEHDRQVKAETLEKVADDLPSMAGWSPQEAETILLAQKRIRTYRGREQ